MVFGYFKPQCEKSLGVFQAIARSDVGIKSFCTEFSEVLNLCHSWLYKIVPGNLSTIAGNIHRFHNINLLLNIVKTLKCYFFRPLGILLHYFLVRALYLEPRTRPYEIRIYLHRSALRALTSALRALTSALSALTSALRALLLY